MKTRRAFSLIELVVALSLSAFVLVGIVGVASQMIRFQMESANKGDVTGWTLLSLQRMNKEIVDATVLQCPSAYPGCAGVNSDVLSGCSNYTRMTTEGNYGAGNSISLTPNPVGKVAGFNPMTANAGVSYIRNKATLRLSANHRGRFLATYNVLESRRIYRVARTQVDLKMLYTISKRFDVYLDVNNVLNGPDRQSELEGGRPERIYLMSPSLIFGTNIRL